ncbi:MAG TPA: VWA domain-containing protein [Terriglobales bacterium]|nr:VWA domain-containing protein [Terriglobales bacterium]
MKLNFAHLFWLIVLTALAGGIFAAPSSSHAQGKATETQSKATAASTDQPVTTMSVQVKVVNVLATVRDKHGKIINNLGKDDFTLSEDGRPQSIRYFSRETDIPLTLGLLVDTSMSQRRVLSEEREASQSFLAQMLREDEDKAFVIHFDREVELLQDLTASHEKLRAALESLETPQFSRTSGGNSPGGGGGSGPGSGRHHGGGTLLYDAVYLASDELMAKQQGRKALIVLSDGVDMGSKENLDEAIESAQRANTVVYSILFKDDEAYGNGGGFGRTGISIPGMGGPGMGGGGMGRGGMGRGRRLPEQHADGKKVLERVSKETGGRMFEVSKKEPVDQIYSQIEEELRNQYSLGYTPDRGSGVESGYHKIQVAARQKDLTVQARDGYYYPSK